MPVSNFLFAFCSIENRNMVFVTQCQKHTTELGGDFFFFTKQEHRMHIPIPFMYKLLPRSAYYALPALFQNVFDSLGKCASEGEWYFIQWPYCVYVVKETVYISKLVHKNESQMGGKKSGGNTNRATKEYINMFSLLFCLFDFEPDSHLTRPYRQPKLINLTMWRPMKYVMFYACLVHWC